MAVRPWLLRAAARLAPGPDLVILLDAPPEVLLSRKQEVPRRRGGAATGGVPGTCSHPAVGRRVNAAQLPEDVIHDALGGHHGPSGPPHPKAPSHSRPFRIASSKLETAMVSRPGPLTLAHVLRTAFPAWDQESGEDVARVGGPRHPAGRRAALGRNRRLPGRGAMCFEAGGRSRSVPACAGVRWWPPRRWGCFPAARCHHLARSHRLLLLAALLFRDSRTTGFRCCTSAILPILARSPSSLWSAGERRFGAVAKVPALSSFRPGHPE